MLMLLKYAVEALATSMISGQFLSPWEFLTPLVSGREAILRDSPEWFGWSLLAWTLPFVWVAFSMSVRRATNAGWSPWIGTLVLVPLLNLAVMLLLAVVKGTAGSWSQQTASSTKVTTQPGTPRNLAAFASALLLGMTSLGLGVYLFESYGVLLFFTAPVLMGCLSGFVQNHRAPQSWSSTVGMAVLSIFGMSCVMLLFALEGIICLLMALPLTIPLAICGALVGKAVAISTHTSIESTACLLALLPLVGATDLALSRHAPVHVVTSNVVVRAPAEAVWQHVVSFPDLPPPDDWFFRSGIACPLRARIEGEGVGAIRYCEFTTGAFVEPITIWRPHERLGFDVTSQPDPMKELSPYRHVHPPHLAASSLRSLRGEFELIPLSDGRTRLIGRTWYTFDMHPRGYWTMWSHYSIHKIHDRVLNHIKRLAEEERGGGQSTNSD